MKPQIRDCVDSCVSNGELDYAELCEAKRLLKVAVDDLSYCNELCYYNTGCGVCVDCDNIPCNKFQWRYADEALKLIGDVDNETN